MQTLSIFAGIVASNVAAIIIIRIGFLKASLWLAFKKPILVFAAPKVLQTLKFVKPQGDSRGFAP
ncbi:hypothetical protein HCU40_04075 [Pseudanabaena biceps]|nr:hypothetical protein [Pseudanabaena biceps]